MLPGHEASDKGRSGAQLLVFFRGIQDFGQSLAGPKKPAPSREKRTTPRLFGGPLFQASAGALQSGRVLPAQCDGNAGHPKSPAVGTISQLGGMRAEIGKRLVENLGGE